MAKYENIRALAKKQLQAVTESSDRWKAFLRTAAIAYGHRRISRTRTFWQQRCQILRRRIGQHHRPHLQAAISKGQYPSNRL